MENINEPNNNNKIINKDISSNISSNIDTRMNIINKDTIFFNIKAEPKIILNKTGKILEPIPFIKANLKKQITDDLQEFFNISFNLNLITPDIANIYSSQRLFIEQFNEIYKEKGLSGIVKNEISIEDDKLLFTDTSVNPPQKITFTFVDNLSSGADNTVKKYTYNNKSYIFREYKRKGYFNELFICFYENLKHLILYIVMCRYNRKLKIIPQPFGMGIYPNTDYYTRLEGSVPSNIGFITESGKSDLIEYLNTQPNEHLIQMISYQIYKELFTINNILDMNLCFMHDDIKADNIVLTDDNYPLLIDFGLSTFKIDNIIFGYGHHRCDRYYNLASEFFIFLYNINYHIFTFNISLDERCIYNKNTFIKLIKIIQGSAFNVSTLRIYGILSDNFSKDINIFAGYIYELTPTDLLEQMMIEPVLSIQYEREIFYKKYLKYKQKYLQLQKSNIQKGGYIQTSKTYIEFILRDVDETIKVNLDDNTQIIEILNKYVYDIKDLICLDFHGVTDLYNKDEHIPSTISKCVISYIGGKPETIINTIASLKPKITSNEILFGVIVYKKDNNPISGTKGWLITKILEANKFINIHFIDDSRKNIECVDNIGSEKIKTYYIDSNKNPKVYLDKLLNKL